MMGKGAQVMIHRPPCHGFVGWPPISSELIQRGNYKV